MGPYLLFGKKLPFAIFHKVLYNGTIFEIDFISGKHVEKSEIRFGICGIGLENGNIHVSLPKASNASFLFIHSLVYKEVMNVLKRLSGSSSSSAATPTETSPPWYVTEWREFTQAASRVKEEVGEQAVLGLRNTKSALTDVVSEPKSGLEPEVIGGENRPVLSKVFFP